MNARLNMSIATTGTALILLTGCVSSKKYHKSQAELAQVRTDSTQLANQVTSLNGNVQDLQNKNTALQQSLDKTTNDYSAQQKTLDYYHGYFKDQQDTLNQVSEDVKSALTQAGIANGDVQQTNNTVYVRFDENEIFKKNSTMITPAGKKALDGLSQVIANRSRVNVAVATGDSAVAWTAADDKSADATMNMAPKHHRTVHHSTMTKSSSTSATSSTTASSTTATTSTASNGNAAPTHKVVHHRSSSEGSTATMYNGQGRMHNKAWALKQGRMVTVADHFLKNGLPKINLSLQHPPMNGTPQSTDIKIIITPKMENFNPRNNSAAIR